MAVGKSQQSECNSSGYKTHKSQEPCVMAPNIDKRPGARLDGSGRVYTNWEWGSNCDVVWYVKLWSDIWNSPRSNNLTYAQFMQFNHFGKALLVENTVINYRSHILTKMFCLVLRMYFRLSLPHLSKFWIFWSKVPSPSYKQWSAHLPFCASRRRGCGVRYRTLRCSWLASNFSERTATRNSPARRKVEESASILTVAGAMMWQWFNSTVLLIWNISSSNTNPSTHPWVCFIHSGRCLNSTAD